jgi:hypothetical protein
MKKKLVYVTLLIAGIFLVSCDDKKKKAPLFLTSNSVSNSSVTSAIGEGSSRENEPSSGSASAPHSDSDSQDSSRTNTTSCSLNNPGHSWGDPHLRTLDGLVYDFQGLGEYWLIRTSEGKSGIQVRQEPWKSNKKVTVNTAVALKVGTHIVSIYLNGKMYVDKVLTSISNGGKINLDGGSVSLSNLTYKITLPEGSVYSIVRSSTYINIYLNNVKIEGKVAGLLGNCNGNFRDDLIPREGSTAISPISFDNLYRVFGESWRLRNSESWFEYSTGEAIGSFDGIPEKITTIDPAAIDRAEIACQAQGITNAVLFDACVLDVALTGDTSFAESIANNISPPAEGSAQMYYEVLAAITADPSSNTGGGTTGGNSGDDDANNGNGGNSGNDDDKSCHRDRDDKEHNGNRNHRNDDDDKRYENRNKGEHDGNEHHGSYNSERDEKEHHGSYNKDGDKKEHSNKDRNRKCENKGDKHRNGKHDRKEYHEGDGTLSGRCQENSNSSSVKNRERCSIYRIWQENYKS